MDAIHFKKSDKKRMHVEDAKADKVATLNTTAKPLKNHCNIHIQPPGLSTSSCPTRTSTYT
jgi:hypothetical protein